MTLISPPARTADVAPAWAPRRALELIAEQLAGVDSWNAARVRAEQQLAATPGNREAALDARRRIEALRREVDAVRCRSELALRDSGELMRARPRPRALIVHRQAWLCGKVATGLAGAGVTVLGVLDDGADAVGWAVAEQPDLLLLEQMLPTLTGQEVVRRVRMFSPSTVIAAQVAYEPDVQPMLDAGADLAVTRRVPPADLTAVLLERVSV